MERIENKYVKFICSELPKEIMVSLRPPDGLDIGLASLYPKLRPNTMVSVLIKEIYTRSAKLLLRFNNIETEFIFFVPFSRSPESILNGLYDRVESKVNKIIVQEGMGEWVTEKYKKLHDERVLVYKKIGESFNKYKINIDNE